MNFRRFVTSLLIILLISVFRPSGFWRELQRMWAQRETITRILTVLVLAYLAYGIYQLYSEGWLVHWFGG